ncbi:pilus assembly protein [Caenimonas soli]|uniref:pilus assembly protein n=1 Tax=Caenimonas soli TaxID=2735555 RepID=UPI001551E509|nr:PilC/PilY family type IV pilus protein [Caenimonas soli]NPC56711.1 PQQ-binding-like beta-propeller repeat protein [Caenimonas soli]
MYQKLYARLRTTARAVGCCAGAFAALAWMSPAQADDIDIFMAGTTGGGKPNIMIMVDNSSNWARSAQDWPDNGGKQGAAELQALINVLNAKAWDANMGFAGFTGSGSSAGGYIRFGLRDMLTAANKTALTNILNHIKADINSPAEKVNDNAEAAALYEVYKYFKAQSPFRGGYVSGNDPASNVDKDNNLGNPSSGTNKPTAFAQGLNSEFALKSNGNYLGPVANSCGNNHVIFVVNNAQGLIPTGSQSYESVSAGDPLPLLAGVSDVSWTDEWARMLYQNGITVHILDAYNKQHNVSHSAVLQRAAISAGGMYFAVKNQADIEIGFDKILAQINAVNSNFAAASLPISATNRSQSLNQVFIGMFRPNTTAEPRWLGNLKQYQLIKTASGAIDLGDVLGTGVVNLQTGFVTGCAISHWTSDSGSFWTDTRDNALSRSGCTVYPTLNGVTGSQWSDMPDGPVVEKGGVAEVIRKGNNPSVTNASPTWTVSRSIQTYSTSTTSKLEPITTTNTGWSTTMLNWVKGYDDGTSTVVDGVTTYPYSEFITPSATARTRPSLHGDVIHSRPLPVNYGTATYGVTVYYGSNDGMFRAVDAATGQERWAFVAPEHYTKFQRLHDNSPFLNFPNVPAALTPKSKDYFFDGSVGIYQTADNSKVWIFPSQRRGGRMLYAFDVTNPTAPTLKWRVGCPNLTDNTGCTTGFENMGQTWSIPSVAFLKGHSTTTPVVVVGGGYDSCEDTDDASPTCASRKGTGVYIINADTGALIKHLDTPGGSVVADIAMSDANGDRSVDYAYAVTTTGDIWRIDFSNATLVPQADAAWSIRKVAYTTGGGRKFLYPPALLRTSTKMYVAVGSGDREHPLSSQYPYDDQITNRFYVYLDDLTVPASSTTATAVNMDTDTGMKNFTDATASTCATPGVTPSSGLKGWYMGLPGRGEQSVTSALIAAGMVTFNTNRATPGGTNACTNPLGEARGYWVNLFNASGSIGVSSATCGGSRSSVFAGGGLTPSPTLATVRVGDKDETVAIGAAQRSGGASAGIAPQEVKPPISSKRKTIFWKSNTAD